MNNKIKTEEFEFQDWKFIFKSGGILSSTAIDKLGDELKLNNVCDVVFGDNV